MDPLSLAANIIAVVGAANSVAKRLESFRGLTNAPEQLLQLLNEVRYISNTLN